jgi:hypothetical protein
MAVGIYDPVVYFGLKNIEEDPLDLQSAKSTGAD